MPRPFTRDVASFAWAVLVHTKDKEQEWFKAHEKTMLKVLKQ